MEFGNNIKLKRFAAQFIFLAVPTIFVAAFLLWRANAYFSILRDQWVEQLIYYAAGLVIALIFYIKRFRFLTTFSLLILLFFVAYKFLDNIAVGEFDAFFISKQFLVFAILFSFGWICGWGFQRLRYFPILLSSLFFLLGIYLISKTGEFNLNTIFFILLPITFYGIYLLFSSNEIYKSKQSNFLSYRNLIKRLFFFLLLMGLVSTAVIAVMYDEIVEKIENYGGGESNEDNSMLKKNKDGSVSNQEQLKINENNNRTNKLVFCAFIDNMLEDMDIPNPLYMNSYYFTKFDTLTETFERDKNVPFNDEFTPDPSQIPLFSIETQRNKIDSGLSNKNRKEVEIEVYKKNLAKDAFLAPSTAFEIQPITVEKDYQAEFKYAYRAKSYVSDLNSAYFIYNSDNQYIQQFQEQRFAELRRAKSYKNVPERFLNYYTHFPSAKKFSNFKSLADSLAKGKKHTIDKVLAIRNYFQQKNALGEAVYSYSDNPGIPGLPGASKLSTFMFQEKKGWCTYYAGSTLLMLRAMNIPSRISVGFLTVDRSDNNKGWYWFYEDQAHAWVQVYFPEYGWLDFDFTIGNEEAEQSPEPDRTPPLQPPKPVLVVSGELQTIDTIENVIRLKSNHLIYNKKEFKDINKKISLNVASTKIWKDSLQITIAQLKKGDTVMSVSYDPKISFYPSSTIEKLLAKLPKNIPMDELYVKTEKQKEITTPEEKTEELKSWTYYIIWSIVGLLLLIIFILSLPYLTFKLFEARIKKAKSEEERAYRIFRASSFYLNQLGYSRKSQSFLQFAKQQVVPAFNNQYDTFAKYYLKIKYAKQNLNQKEQAFIHDYWSIFYKESKKKFDKKTSFKKFLNLNKYVQYFYLPKLEEANGRTT